MSDVKFAEKLISAIYFDFELCIHGEKTVRSEKWLNKMTGISTESTDFLAPAILTSNGFVTVQNIVLSLNFLNACRNYSVLGSL